MAEAPEYLCLGGSRDGCWITGGPAATRRFWSEPPPTHPDAGLTAETYELVRLAPGVLIYVAQGVTVAQALQRLVRAYIPTEDRP